MPTKPDYYAVLDVSKTASTDEIKRAFMKISMQCHPDRVKNRADLTPAQKEEASAKFQIAREAHEVLTDATKRAAYDRGGHAALSGVKTGVPTTAPRGSYKDAVGTDTTVRGRDASEDDGSFFRKRSGGDSSSSGSSRRDDGDGETAEQRRARAAEERRRNRETQKGGATATTPSSTADDIADAADRLKDATDAGVTLPLDVLRRFRENLQDLMREVDAAMDRARRNNNSNPRP